MGVDGVAIRGEFWEKALSSAKPLLTEEETRLMVWLSWWDEAKRTTKRAKRSVMKSA